MQDLAGLYMLPLKVWNWISDGNHGDEGRAWDGNAG